MIGISLFSGIGGLDAAAEAAGIEPVLFCEIEPYPASILRKRWPDVPILDDVRKLTKEVVPDGSHGTIDIVYGGFPQ